MDELKRWLSLFGIRGEEGRLLQISSSLCAGLYSMYVLLYVQTSDEYVPILFLFESCQTYVSVQCSKDCTESVSSSLMQLLSLLYSFFRVSFSPVWADSCDRWIQLLEMTRRGRDWRGKLLVPAVHIFCLAYYLNILLDKVTYSNIV